MRLTEQQVRSLYGQDVQDRSGAKIGSVGQVWADPSGEATWVSVKTGVMGHHESMAPLDAARMQQDGRLQVQYDKATVRSAPSVETGTNQPLSTEQLAQLYRHYQIGEQAGPPPKQKQQAGGPEMVRSEERLRVGTESEPAGAARLSKRVVTENVQTSVPVEHDEVTVVHEPILDADRANVRAGIGEEQREMELRAERPVVAKEQVPVERVRLNKDEIVEEQPVNAQVRRELVDADVPERARRNR
ncbi:YsnF/AvaK domain-containing protein [Micromonospora chersina]|uniref:Conserved domain-containing protein n=1 Tax=Micromonospora chersina TaxID=47854 RepID=A0A1C6VZN7_9ACTN|nr:YsnF/AvaK domain-containing protein [Micromonospora chersina]SCL71793.1 conserved domain-containing protein [Micromonospora chersina]